MSYTDKTFPIPHRGQVGTNWNLTWGRGSNMIATWPTFRLARLEVERCAIRDLDGRWWSIGLLPDGQWWRALADNMPDDVTVLKVRLTTRRANNRFGFEYTLERRMLHILMNNGRFWKVDKVRTI